MITVVGEALVDLVESPDGTRVAHPGGSPANVAVGLGRLGNAVALLTRYGHDAHGAVLAEHLAAGGVAVVGSPEDDLPTSTALVRTDPEGVVDYTFSLAWRLPHDPVPQVPPETVCLHIGSVAATLAPGAASVFDLVERARGRCTVSYDPNCRPSLMGRPSDVRSRIESLVALADVVKVSDEDLAWLYAGRAPSDVAAEWLGLGPALVVVTRGASGCIGLCAAGEVERPAVRVRVVDTVGAGDAFTAGLLDAFARRALLGPAAGDVLRRLPLGELGRILDEASLVSALTCARAGANPPSVEELAAFRT